MKQVQLTRGKVALVDDDFFNFITLRYYSYHYADQGEKNNHRGYAKRTLRSRDVGNVDHPSMHFDVLEFNSIEIPPGMDVDHKNGNTLDNQLGNFQFLTRAQNLLKKKRTYKNKVGFRGVIVRPNTPRGIQYRAYVNHEGETVWCGTFRTPEDAARAHDAKAKELQGEFANLNFP